MRSAKSNSIYANFTIVSYLVNDLYWKKKAMCGAESRMMEDAEFCESHVDILSR